MKLNKYNQKQYKNLTYYLLLLKKLYICYIFNILLLESYELKQESNNKDFLILDTIKNKEE